MKASASPRIWTDDQLMALDRDGRKHELWFGKIITMPPAGFEHGEIIARLLNALATYVYAGRLGSVCDGQTGFRLSLDLCLEPDISFISKERLKLILPAKEKLLHGAPDLAVEVLSPSDSITKREQELNLFLIYGSRLAWMVDPKNKTVRVYRPGQEFELLRGERMLTGNSVLPGFRVSLARIFEGA